MGELTWTTKTGFSGPNPFVGPRPIQRGEALYGRDTEIRELFDLLQARRIAVLHAPAGAGKTSLVEAGLVPRLKKSRFDVWAPVRVDLDARDLEGAPPDANHYLLSTMVSLERELPKAHRRSVAELAQLDLLGYLDSRPRRKGRAGRSVVLLFEQFERILAAEPGAMAAKQEFFAAVGDALESENYWALFIIREEHLGALAPYRDRVPTQMSNTYRLDLLSSAQSREVVTKLAENSGRSFPASDALIKELSAVRVQRPDGRIEVEPGTHVEPTHLQLVGRRLWDAMPDDDLSIDEEDVALYAKISDALEDYYADAMRSIAKGDVATERAVRDWVGHTLIVGGVRAQVQQAAQVTAQLDDQVIDELRACRLVRAEQRAGTTWLELSRDRLIEPIVRDNERWERAHLHPLQLKAIRWEAERRERALLLEARELQEANEWAQTHAEQVTDSERDFLEQSMHVRAEEARNQRTRRVFEYGAKALVVVGLTAVVLGGLAWKQLSDAADEIEQAHVRAERMQQEATAEARHARDMRRVLVAYALVHPPTGGQVPAEGRREAAATALGILAELEGDDVRQAMREVGESWPSFLARMSSSVLAGAGEVSAEMSEEELRRLLWVLGRCPDRELRAARLGRAPQQAAEDERRCADMRACVGCSVTSDGPGCFEPGGPTHASLRPEVAARLDACREEFRRAQAVGEPFSPAQRPTGSSVAPE